MIVNGDLYPSAYLKFHCILAESGEQSEAVNAGGGATSWPDIGREP
jgi:hypothetical protein